MWKLRELKSNVAVYNIPDLSMFVFRPLFQITDLMNISKEALKSWKVMLPFLISPWKMMIRNISYLRPEIRQIRYLFIYVASFCNQTHSKIRQISSGVSRYDGIKSQPNKCKDVVWRQIEFLWRLKKIRLARLIIKVKVLNRKLDKHQKFL